MLRPNSILPSDIEAILVVAQSPGLSNIEDAWYAKMSQMEPN